MAGLKLLGISGSLRKASFNTMLVKEAARLFEPETFILADIRMPLYDGDLEEAEGLPEAAKNLRSEIAAADAIVISTPEYNKNLPGVLKNALDWISRERPMPMANKPVAVISAAAGIAGGARAQYSLRHCLTPFGPRVLQGPECLIGSASKAFDEDGRLVNEQSTTILQKLMEALKQEALG